MKGRSRWRASAPVLAIGTAIAGFAIVHAIVRSEALLAEFLDAGILLVFASAVMAVGYRIADEGLDWPSAMRILSFVVGASVVVGGLSGVYVLARLTGGDPIPGIAYVLSIGFSLGAAAGALIGVYLDRYERSLQHEAELSRRLTVLQRVLRHNIRNEVSIIEGVSRDLTDRADDPDVRKGLETITDHIGKVYRLAEKSQDLATVWQTDGTVDVDAVPAIGDAIETVQANHPSATITQELPDILVVDAHPRIGMAFEEALDNAARHNQDDVDIDVTATVDDASTTIRFSDTGAGIPASEVAPLIRGHERPLDHTTGIGLWFIYWLVDHSNGTLTFTESDAGGTVVEMRLPTV